MKNIYIKQIAKLPAFLIGGLFAVVQMLTSCSDALKEDVYSEFTEDNFFTSVGSAELALFGVYDGITDRYLYGEKFMIAFQQGSDHANYWRQNRGFEDDLLVNYQINETNTYIADSWAHLYNSVYRVNMVIDRTLELRDEILNNPTISDNPKSDLEGYNNVLGDAYFLRGFLYFQLTRNWGDVPLRLKSAPSFDDFKTTRDPQVKVYEQIEKDMLMGISMLPERPNTRSVGRVSKGAAQGVLARVYLHWAGAPLNDVSKYEKATEQALDVIESGQHALLTELVPVEIGGNLKTPVTDSRIEGPDAFKGLMLKTFHNISTFQSDLIENMWELQFSYVGASTDDSSVIGIWHGVKSKDNSSWGRGAPRWYPTPYFYESFHEMDSLRRDWSIARFEIKDDDQFVLDATSTVPDGSNFWAPNWGVAKFRRYLQPSFSPDLNRGSQNFPIIRYADVLLMYAEGVNETIINGGTLPQGASVASAYEALNQVRRRAMPYSPAVDVDIDPATGAGLDFRKDIRNERSWELCFERIRKSDLIRWGILGQTLQETHDGMRALGYDKEDSCFQNLHFDESKHTLLPVPLREISQNPNILDTDPSNNGYR